MLTKKGMSLIEIIISIALISVVVIFMYKLLLDVNNEMTNNTFAISNQQNRLEIIKTIENDLIKANITSLNKNNNTITLTDNASKTYTISYDDPSLSYNNGIPYKWTINNASIEINKVSICYNNNILKINIMVTTLNDYNSNDNNNKLDDIEIVYVGENNISINGSTTCSEVG